MAAPSSGVYTMEMPLLVYVSPSPFWPICSTLSGRPKSESRAARERPSRIPPTNGGESPAFQGKVPCWACALAAPRMASEMKVVLNMERTLVAALRLALKLRAQGPLAQGGGAAEKKARRRGNAILPYW